MFFNYVRILNQSLVASLPQTLCRYNLARTTIMRIRITTTRRRSSKRHEINYCH